MAGAMFLWANDGHVANASLSPARHKTTYGHVMVGIIRFYAYKKGAFHLIDVKANNVEQARQQLLSQGYKFDLVEGGDAFYIDHIDTV